MRRYAPVLIGIALLLALGPFIAVFPDLLVTLGWWRDDGWFGVLVYVVLMAAVAGLITLPGQIAGLIRRARRA